MLRADPARWMLVLLAGPVAAVPACAQQSPDLVLANGKVFTADPARPRAEAIAIAGDRIVAVGEEGEIAALAGPGTRVLDLDGRLVVPGLIDAHEHVAFGVPEGVSPELPGPDPTWGQVVAAVERAASSATEGAWIRATIGPAVLFDPRADRFALDEVAPSRPVWLTAFTGHGMLLNSAGLRALGVPEDPEDPVGGWHGRAKGEGVPDGWLWEYAQWRSIREWNAERSPAAAVGAIRKFADRAAEWGITTVHELASTWPLPAHLAALERARPPIRWTVYRFPTTADSVGEAFREAGGGLEEAAPGVRVGGVKWVLDGTPVEGNLLHRRPAGREGYGRMNFDRSAVHRILAHALEGEEQVALHVAGDSTLALVLGTMEELAPPVRWRPVRVRIEHGDGLGDDLLPRAARLGVILVQNPLHFSLGPLPASPQSLRSAVEAGIPVALGADAGGPQANPWLNLMLAVRHPAHPDEGLSREQALIAYTRGGATAEFAEGEKGRLASGMLADLAVLTQDILTVPAERLPETRSVLTLVGGEVVHDAGVVRQVPAEGASR